MTLPALARRWAAPALFLLGLFLWFGAWPLLLHLVFLPAVDPSRTGPALEYHGKDALYHGVWQAPSSGVWRLEATAPTGFDLYLDGKRLVHAPDFLPHNGGGCLLRLERGPHLVVVEMTGARGLPQLNLAARAPGGNRAVALAAKDISRLDLGNFDAWWYTLSWLKFLGPWLALAGLLLWLKRGGAFTRLALSRAAHPAGRWPVWIAVGLLGLGLYLVARPLFMAAHQDAGSPGMKITCFAGRNLHGGVMGSERVGQSADGTQAAQSSMLAYAWLEVDRPGPWSFELSLDDYGRMGLGRRVLARSTVREIPVFRKVEARLEPGLHLLWVECDNLGGPGGFSLKGAPKGEDPRLLGGGNLFLTSFSRPDLWLKAVTWARYLGLALLAACLAGLIRLWVLPAAWRLSARTRPGEALLACLAVWAGLALFLRIALMLDITWPAPAAQLIAGLGLAAALAGLLLGWLRDEKPNDPMGANPPWALVCILAGAFILRALFLPHMEYKADEEGIWHMALNLIRHGVPYLTGIATSQGGYNPPGFLYLLGPAAAISHEPLHAGLYCALVGTVAVGVCFALGRRLAGRKTGLAAAALLAASPWAIRYAMKLWPQGFLILLLPLLCLLLMRQSKETSLRLSLLIGLVAGFAAQLHFTGLLLVAGLALATFLAGGWPGLKRSGAALAGFLLAWAPYLAFLAIAGAKAAPEGSSLLTSVPGQSALPLWLAGRVLGGMDLASAVTLGKLAAEFQAGLWAGFVWLQRVPWLLALAGLVLMIFSRGSDGAVSWLKVFIFAACCALLGQIALGLPPQMHYLAFALPWGFLLTGLCLGRLAHGKGGGTSRAALGMLIVLAVAGGVFFWQWQDFLGSTGGGGEYGKAYYLQQNQAGAAARQKGILPTPVPDELCAPWGRRLSP